MFTHCVFPHSHELNGKNAQVATIKIVVPPFLAKRAVVGHCWTTVEGQLTVSRIKMENKNIRTPQFLIHRLFLLGVAFSSGCSLRPMPEGPRGVPSNPWEKSGREGNGRTKYGIHSPYTPSLDKEDEELVPTCPPRDAESVSGNGVSLEALAGIVRQEINAAVTPMHSQLSSLQVTLGARMDQVENALHKHDLQIQKFEQYMADTMDQGFSNNVAQDVEKQLQDLQAQIDDLKEPGTAIQAGSEDFCKTMVVGGLIGLPSLPEATRWLNSQLSQLQGPKHVGTYMKSSSFQGLMFVKFKNVDDRDEKCRVDEW